MVYHKQENNVWEKLILIFVLILLGYACQGRSVLLPESRPAPQDPLLLGYTIQTGAFSVLDNAVRMTENLNRQDYEAFYFRHESGLFKVRLGDYSSYGEAERAARNLLKSKVIKDYFIVPPMEKAKADSRTVASNTFRDHLVTTAKRYISYPYTWGGDSPDEGFDCSGLVLAVYRLNGLNLPRTSSEQFKTGNPVPPDRLKKGDLVFFKTVPGAKVSHVGIYVGNDLFIHASSRNRIIRYDSLSSPFYSKYFVGACAYF
jgi:hypothetical protein